MKVAVETCQIWICDGFGREKAVVEQTCTSKFKERVHERQWRTGERFLHALAKVSGRDLGANGWLQFGSPTTTKLNGEINSLLGIDFLLDVDLLLSCLTLNPSSSPIDADELEGRRRNEIAKNDELDNRRMRDELHQRDVEVERLRWELDAVRAERGPLQDIRSVRPRGQSSVVVVEANTSTSRRSSDQAQRAEPYDERRGIGASSSRDNDVSSGGEDFSPSDCSPHRCIQYWANRYSGRRSSSASL
ncbi:hypothetical protein U1Q18_020267 [Sarracenia purpurea var. burkii]